MIRAISALIIVVLLFSGCHDDAGHGHEHDESGTSTNESIELEKEMLTLFTDKLELFVEFDPLIKGRISEFNSHFTILDDNYSPLQNAEIILELKIKDKKTIFKGHSEVPGIYKFDVKPDVSGEGDISYIIKTDKFEDKIVIKHQHIFNSLDDVHFHGNDVSSGDIFFTKEQAWSSEFNVLQIQPRTFSGIVKASGEILAMPGEKQNLIAKNEGIIVFSKRNLVQGSPVQKGEILFTVSSKGFTDDNITVEYHQALMNYDKSKSQYQRHKNLVQERIVSQSQFIESRNRYFADSVAFFNLKENVSSGGLNVVAPLKGYIHDLNVSEGQFVSTGSLLSTISSNKVLLLRADVSQTYFSELGSIQDANFRPAYTNKVYTIDELGGKLLAKASSVAENNHYMPVYFEVNNDGTLLEGAFAEFYLITKPQNNKLIVPVSAIMEEQNVFFVYVQVSGETFHKQNVNIGGSNGIHSEIITGLKAGDRIVTKGAMLVKAASVTAAPIHSHSH